MSIKNIAILGSTGSIGLQTLDIISKYPDKFKVVGLSSFGTINKMVEQAKIFKPKLIGMADKEKVEKLKELLPGSIEVVAGEKGNHAIATMDEMDTLVTSVVGAVGLTSTIKAIKAGKNIALANKETLVAGGSIVMKEVRKHQVNLMPIDSEHSALFQCLNGENKSEISRIIITCSGGSFRFKTRKALENVTVKEALNHPNWSMGNKITIDSASLMNKGLEVIEAHWLYDCPYEKIDIVMHPQSIIHSMVEFQDGQVMAELGQHDMRLPILYALSYPDRLAVPYIPKLDFAKLAKLEFYEIDHETFPCLNYAYEAGKKGGTMPAIMNASNEIANAEFLNGKIKFLDIEKIVKHGMDSVKMMRNPNLDDILDADNKAREEAKKFIGVIHL